MSTKTGGDYASRLSYYPNKGICGLPESIDTKRSYQNKIRQCISIIQQISQSTGNTKSKKKKIVIITGAGISTAAGISDFRGPNGIWTIEQQQQKKKQQKDQTTTAATHMKRKRSTSNSSSDNNETTPSSSTCQLPTMNFMTAQPTITHQIITKLVQEYHQFHFVITQNVDGLHRKSGLLRHHHAILHGCIFTEYCNNCRTEYFRNYDVGTIGFQYTGRFCTNTNCNKHPLQDTVLDWDDPLPEYDHQRAIEYCTDADLILCLGTSLRISPVNELPLLGKQYIIVNLQVTPLDEQATLIIRERVDIVMSDIYTGLGYNIHDIDASNSKTNPPNIERMWVIPKIEDDDDDDTDTKQHTKKKKKTTNNNRSKKQSKEIISCIEYATRMDGSCTKTEPDLKSH